METKALSLFLRGPILADKQSELTSDWKQESPGPLTLPCLCPVCRFPKGFQAHFPAVPSTTTNNQAFCLAPFVLVVPLKLSFCLSNIATPTRNGAPPTVGLCLKPLSSLYQAHLTKQSGGVSPSSHFGLLVGSAVEVQLHTPELLCCPDWLCRVSRVFKPDLPLRNCPKGPSHT